MATEAHPPQVEVTCRPHAIKMPDTDQLSKARALAIQMLHSAQHRSRTARMTQQQPAAQLKVHVYKPVEASDASPHLPVGSMATGGQPSQAGEHYRPQAAPEADVSSKEAAQPSQILCRCLAQASAAAEKLDRLSASQAGCGEKVLARVHPTPSPSH